MAERVQGIGGVFFKAADPAGLQQWYAENLGIGPRRDSPWGGDDPASLLRWRDADDPDRTCHTVFAPFEQDTDYFAPSHDAAFMLNLRVDDLDAMLAQLALVGTDQVGETVLLPYGRFARVLDPEGNVLELWEPAEGF